MNKKCTFITILVLVAGMTMLASSCYGEGKISKGSTCSPDKDSCCPDKDSCCPDKDSCCPDKEPCCPSDKKSASKKSSTAKPACCPDKEPCCPSGEKSLSEKCC